jgi:transcriptional regulator with XRE-family HTH domain
VANEDLGFGQELRRRRIESDLTLAQLAALVHYSKAHLSKVERGLQTPSRELVRLCDSALHAGGKLAARAEGNSVPSDPGETSQDEVTWLMMLSENGDSRLGSMTRRQLMSAGLLAIPGVNVAGKSTSLARDQGVHPAALKAFGIIFDNLRQLGQISDPESLIPSLIANNNLIQQHAKTASGDLRKKLLVLSSRYAEYTGWLFQETGNDQAAIRWTGQSVALAEAGGDPDFVTYALVRQSLIALYRSDAKQTVQLAQRAQSLTASPRITGLAALREAQGHALALDYDASMRALDRCGELLDRAEGDRDQPVIGTSNLADPAGMAKGWCLYDLGRPGTAERVIGEQLARVPGQALRTRARYGARRALACAAAGEIDHACHIASGVLDDVGVAKSATITHDLRTLTRALARYPKAPSVRELTPRLSAALQATS